ncbi:MAG TPA: DEAD/DEAH box helicase [Candidatus Hydrogenedentes bacterium]|nr:DEAD/DEAH box helicase [Candidatus Hydrogenedentota bacterium]HPG68013.1 DEAD/DEAH box helicase [Candidatus Hydrogenedentota bacterium]
MDNEEVPSPSFGDFEIDARCLSVIHAQGISEPTPIQAQTIPPALAGRDVVALAQTGTGKTLAFTLPSLTRLAAGPARRNLMLVLAPTRELAVQMHGVIEELGRPLQLHCACVYGGVGFDKQTQSLRRGCAVVVATPGRLLDHMSRGNVRFDDLEILVIDEADRMLDMGFLPDLQRILRALPENRQTIMCSATFPDEIARLARTMLNDPVQVKVGSVAQPVDSVRQVLYTVDQERKTSLLVTLLRDKRVLSALVFLRTKRRTDRVTKSLRAAGIKARAIHGDLTQSQRDQALEGFREGRYRVLVATDVAARGLDITGISHVINFDIPENPDDYIHRIGRTARANEEGDAVTFVCPDEAFALAEIERAVGKNLPRADWDGAEDVLSLYVPESLVPKRGSTRHRKRSMLRRR